MQPLGLTLICILIVLALTASSVRSRREQLQERNCCKRLQRILNAKYKLNQLKWLRLYNWRGLLKKQKNINIPIWKKRIKQILLLIRLNKPIKRVPWLNKLRRIVRKIKSQLSNRKRVSKELKLYVKIFTNYNWRKVLTYYRKRKVRKHIIRFIERMIKIRKTKAWRKVNFRFMLDARTMYNFLRFLWLSHIPKNDIRLKLIEYVRFIIKRDWTKLIKKVKNIKHDLWIKRINQFNRLMRVGAVMKHQQKHLPKMLKILKQIANQILTKNKIKSIFKIYVNKTRRMNFQVLVGKIKNKNVRKRIMRNLKFFNKIYRSKSWGKIDSEIFFRIRETIRMLNRLNRLDKDEKEGKNSRRVDIKRTIRYLIKINWRKQLLKLRGKDRQKWKREISRIIDLVKRNKGGKINSQWLTKLRVFLRKIRRNKNRKIKWVKYIKWLQIYNWRRYLRKIKNINFRIWNKRIRKILLLIRLKKPITRVPWLNKLKRIVRKIKSQLSNRQRVSKELRFYVKIFTNYNWRKVLTYYKHKNVRKHIIRFIERMIKITKTKAWQKVNFRFMLGIRSIYNLLRRLWLSHIPKNDIRLKIIEYVRFIIKRDWIKLIRKIKKIDMKFWIKRIKHINYLMRNGTIMKSQFQGTSQLIKVLKLIAHQILTKNKIKSVWKIYRNKLKRLNYKVLVRKVQDEKIRNRIIRHVKIFRRIYERKDWSKVDFKFYLTFRNTMRMLSRLSILMNRKGNKVNKYRVDIMERINYLIKIDWRKQLLKLRRKDRLKWKREISKIIDLVKRNKGGKIKVQWIVKLKEFQKMITKLQTSKENKNKEIMFIKLKKFLKFLTILNWKKCVKSLRNEKTKVEFKKSINLLIQIIKSRKLNLITLEFFNKIKSILGKLNQIYLKQKEAQKVGIYKQMMVTISNRVEKLKSWKWKNFVKYFKKSQQKLIRERIKNIISIVDEKKYSSLNKRLYQWFLEIFSGFHEAHVMTTRGLKFNESTRKWYKKTNRITPENRLTTEYFNLKLPANWEKLVKQIKGKSSQIWINRINSLLKSGGGEFNMKWAQELSELVQKINKQAELMKQTRWDATTKSKLIDMVKPLQKWDLKFLISRTKGGNKADIIIEMKRIIKLIEMKRFSELTVQDVDWFKKMIIVIKTVKQYMDEGYKFNKETKDWIKTVSS